MKMFAHHCLGYIECGLRTGTTSATVLILIPRDVCVDIAQPEVLEIIMFHESPAGVSRSMSKKKEKAHLDIRHSRYCLLDALQGVEVLEFFLRQAMYWIILSLHSPGRCQFDGDGCKLVYTIVVEGE